MERTQVPPSCSTYYSSRSYAGPSMLRRAINHLTLQGGGATTDRVFDGHRSGRQLTNSRITVPHVLPSDRRQSDPSVGSGELSHFPESATVQSQPLMRMRATRSPHHMPAVPHIKLVLPPASAEGRRRVLACARDGKAGGADGSGPPGVRQSVSLVGALHKVRSMSDGPILAPKLLSARIKRHAVCNVPTAGSRVRVITEDPTSRQSLYGWTEGSTLMSRGEESYAEEEESEDERREPSTGKRSI